MPITLDDLQVVQLEMVLSPGARCKPWKVIVAEREQAERAERARLKALQPPPEPYWPPEWDTADYVSMFHTQADTPWGKLPCLTPRKPQPEAPPHDNWRNPCGYFDVLTGHLPMQDRFKEILDAEQHYSDDSHHLRTLRRYPKQPGYHHPWVSSREA